MLRVHKPSLDKNEFKKTLYGLLLPNYNIIFFISTY
ncbi:MAG: hypothetical protein H6Q13_448 [Bacteroidetes bacterium]|nr:hypothetical protein [Bacteroidota bacterium]